MRQLESMIRLSEAMARMHCCEEVQPKHVQEAFRLLNKSIIRVETPEINFEQDEPQPLLPDDEGLPDGQAPPDAPNGPSKQAPPKRITVTFQQYTTIANLLVLHMRKTEETMEGRRLEPRELWMIL